MTTIFVWPLEYAPQDFALCQGQQYTIVQYQALYALLGARYGGNSQTNFNIPNLQGRVPVGVSGTSPAVVPLAFAGGSATMTQTIVSTGSVTITTNNMPAHNHNATFNPVTGQATVPISQAGNQGVNIPVGTSVPSSITPTTLSGPQYLNNYQAGIQPSKGGFVSAISGTPVSLATGTNGVQITGSPGITANPTINTVTGGSVTVGNAGSGQPLPVTVYNQLNLNNMQPYLGLNFLMMINGIFPVRP